MLEHIIHSKPYKEYLKISLKIKDYLALDCPPPAALDEAYRNALSDYRYFLDEQGIKMPKPRYLYCQNKKNTWQFIDVVLKNRRENITVKEWVINEEFKP